MNRKSIIITGGAGFIGSNLALYFQNNFPNLHVVVFDIFRTNDTFENGNLKSFGHFKNLMDFEGEIICGDINNPSDLAKLEKYDIEAIFHQAAISDTTVINQNIMMQTNLNAFKSLLELCERKNAKMIYASSGATYGDAPSPQTIGREAPQNVYGFSKLMMDRLAKNYEHLHVVGLRYFNVYGKNEFFKNKTASMVLQLGLQILSGKAPRLFFDSDKILRDFIYIDDVINANILALDCKKNGVYNIGTGIPRSFQDIADILQKEFGTNYTTEYFANPHKAYQMHTQADIWLSHTHLGFKPCYTLEDGIKDYANEIKKVYNEQI